MTTLQAMWANDDRVRELEREIERLRFALGSAVSWADEMKKRDAEIERLRAELGDAQAWEQHLKSEIERLQAVSEKE